MKSRLISHWNWCGCIHCGALVHALLLRSERGCSVTQHQVSARQSACTHEKEDLTSSRFVRVICSSHVVSIKLGTVTPPSLWTPSTRTIGRSSSGLAVLPARATTLPCPVSVSSPASEGLSSPWSCRSRFQGPSPPWHCCVRSVRQGSRLAPAQAVRLAEDRSSAFVAAPLLSDIAASFIAGRRSLTASSLNMLPQCYPPTGLIRADERMAVISIITAESHSELRIRQLLSTWHLPSPKFDETSWKAREWL